MWLRVVYWLVPLHLYPGIRKGKEVTVKFVSKRIEPLPKTGTNIVSWRVSVKFRNFGSLLSLILSCLDRSKKGVK